MPTKPISISMTRFADFVVADPLGQLARLRDVRRQYERPYRPSEDFWSRWRDQVEAIHRGAGSRNDLPVVATEAKDNRTEQYASACDGYSRFWGRKQLEVVAHPRPAEWTYQSLTVRVNPEWVLRVNGTDYVVKLHLKRDLTLNQRLANPLLHLLDTRFGPLRDGPPVAIVDVHRGKLWKQSAAVPGIDAVLQMQAAAFLAGWAQTEPDEGAA